MEKQEIIPTQNIAFAVLTDGTVVHNFADEEGDKVKDVSAENIIAYFNGLEKFIRTCPKAVFAMFGLVYLVNDTRIAIALKERSKAETEEIKKENGI